MPLFEIETNAHIMIAWAGSQTEAETALKQNYPQDEVLRVSKRPREMWVISKKLLGLEGKAEPCDQAGGHLGEQREQAPAAPPEAQSPAYTQPASPRVLGTPTAALYYGGMWCQGVTMLSPAGTATRRWHALVAAALRSPHTWRHPHTQRRETPSSRLQRHTRLAP